MATELETVTVHTDEAGSMRWNQFTHDYKIVELNTDGDIMIDVRPKEGTSVEVGV